MVPPFPVATSKLSVNSSASQSPQPPGWSAEGRIARGNHGTARPPPESLTSHTTEPPERHIATRPSPPPCRTALVSNSFTATTKSSNRSPPSPAPAAQDATACRSAVIELWSNVSVRRTSVPMASTVGDV